MPVGLIKGSGNLGVLAQAVEGMLTSLGPISLTGGSPCWGAGRDAHVLDFGGGGLPNPEQMSLAKGKVQVT